MLHVQPTTSRIQQGRRLQRAVASGATISSLPNKRSYTGYRRPPGRLAILQLSFLPMVIALWWSRATQNSSKGTIQL